MLRELDRPEIIETAIFGDFCPYWTVLDDHVTIADTAEEILLSLPEEHRVIDPVAVLELLQFNYILGDRTIIQGVQRIPWHSTLRWDGKLERHAPLPHSNNLENPKKIAFILRGLLEEELYNAIRNRPHVFLLLSGGLDSRVIAGILKSIEDQVDVNISCVTWGQPESRDRVYAERIANWYDWESIAIPYDASLTWENIRRGAIWGGSEITGVHLHGMDWFRNAQPDDLVIASSFGDMIGRAEFSGVHLKNLSLPPIHNPGGLIHPTIFSELMPLANKDREKTWENVIEADDWIKNEFDMQENYVRRMLCHAMDYIRQFCAVHQAFTSEKVVSYMWSLSTESRTDETYRYLLQGLDPRLYSLPWARTGVAPDGTLEKDPKLTKEFHELGNWLQHDLRPRLEELFFSPGIRDLGLFYFPSMRHLWETWLNQTHEFLGDGENIVKICSLEISRRKFGIRPFRKQTYWRDEISELTAKGKSFAVRSPK
jgi:hypothetical protein